MNSGSSNKEPSTIVRFLNLLRKGHHLQGRPMGLGEEQIHFFPQYLSLQVLRLFKIQDREGYPALEKLKIP